MRVKPSSPKLPLWLRAWLFHQRHIRPRYAPILERWHRKRVRTRCPAMGDVFEEMDAAYYPLSPGEEHMTERLQRGHQNDDSLTFGELSWPSFYRVAQRLEPSAEDHFIELGCGTGRFTFFMHLHWGVEATGIDWSETFIERARAVAQTLTLADVRFLNRDILDFDCANGTLFYVTSGCLTEPQRQRLGHALARAPVGSRVAVVGTPLEAPHLSLLERLKVRFAWGRDDAFIYLVRAA